MQYTGFVKFIGPRETIGEGVEKQTVVLEENTDREFKGSIAVDFFRDKINLLSDVNTGDLITVHLNARANESLQKPPCQYALGDWERSDLSTFAERQ